MLNPRRALGAILLSACAPTLGLLVPAPGAEAATATIELQCSAATQTFALATNVNVSGRAASVAPGATFKERITLAKIPVPSSSGAIKVNHFRDLVVKFDVSAAAALADATLANAARSPGSSVTHSGGLVTLHAPAKVNHGTNVELPDIDLTLKATGAAGTSVTTDTHGLTKADPTLSLTVQVDVGRPLDVPAVCFRSPAGSPLATVRIGTTGRTPSESFVRAGSLDYLAREATPAELADLSGKLDRKATTRAALTGRWSKDPAWLAGAFLDRYYHDTLNRAPDSGGLRYWVGLAQHGTPMARIAAQLYSSAEYFRIFGKGSTATWVGDVYAKVLGRKAAAAGLAYWVGRTNKSGRLPVATAFANEKEPRQKRAAVLVTRLLRRPGTATELAAYGDALLKSDDVALSATIGASQAYFDAAPKHP